MEEKRRELREEPQRERSQLENVLMTEASAASFSTSGNDNVPTQLTSQQIEEFRENGLLVVKNVLTTTEIELVRNNFHTFLAGYGILHDNLTTTASNLSQLSSTGGAGGILDVFYTEWKLALNEHTKIVRILSELWEHTYATASDPLFDHPFGPFDPYKGFMYIDRVCYRLPDTISSLSTTNNSSNSSSNHMKKTRSLQRSLTPHIDCCPHKMFQSVGDKSYNKWRPIQAFIALTDTPDAQMGGFEACPGFHREFNDWSSTRVGSTTLPPSPSPTNGMEKGNDHHEVELPPCVGQFTPIRPKGDQDILQRFQHIPCHAGDLVLWDYRIPHANSYHNNTDHPREVVYIGLLPHIEINQHYAFHQLEAYNQGNVPTDQWHECKNKQPCDYHFSSLGRKLMGIDTW